MKNFRSLRQQGNAVILVIVMLIVVAIIGVSGWLVYQHNQPKPSVVASSKSDVAVVKIPELGVQLRVPASIKDLTYRVEKIKLRNGKTSTIAFFSSRKLLAIDPGCDAAFGSLGRTSGQYPSASQDPYRAIDDGVLVKQLPSFYIAAGFSNAVCSSVESAGSAARAQQANDLQGAGKQALFSAAARLQPLN